MKPEEQGLTVLKRQSDDVGQGHCFGRVLNRLWFDWSRLGEGPRAVHYFIKLSFNILLTFNRFVAKAVEFPKSFRRL
jgi:hypothetical protein